MSIFKGSTELCTLGDIKIGDQDVQEVYVGSTKVFPCSSGKNLFINDFSWGNSVLLPWGSMGLVYTKDFSVEFEGFTTEAYNYVIIQQDHLEGGAQDVYFDLAVGPPPTGQDMPVLYSYGAIHNLDWQNDPEFDWAMDPLPAIGYWGEWNKVKCDVDVSENIVTTTFTNVRGVSYQRQSDMTGSLVGAVPPNNIESHYWMDNRSSIRNVKVWQEGTLLAHWPIDDETSAPSGQIRDVSGNANHGTLRATDDVTWATAEERRTRIKFRLAYSPASGGYVTPADYPWVTVWLRNGSGVQKTVPGGYYEYDPIPFDDPEWGLFWNSADNCWEFYPNITNTDDIYNTEYFLFVNVWLSDGPPSYNTSHFAYLPTQYPNHEQAGDWYDSADAITLPAGDTIYEITLTEEP